MNDSKWASEVQKLPVRDKTENDQISYSPTKQPTKQTTSAPKTPSIPSHKAKQNTQHAQTHADSEAQSRDDALRAELETIRRMNVVIEGVTASLEKAKSNMNTINQTVSNAHTLLDTWTRILSQTEHNQRLILNPAWTGASDDLAEIENELLIRQRERERREAEEAERRAAAEERRRAEEERRRIESGRRETEKKTSRPGSRVGGSGRGRSMPSGRTVSGASSTAGAAGRGSNPTNGSGPAKVGRGATAGYGRLGSVGTKPPRGRGRGVG